MAVTSPASPRVVADPIDVHARLRELGLRTDTLTATLTAGAAAAALCTSNHPPNFSGLIFWGDAVRALRDLLMAEGWRSDNSYNYPTAVRGDGALAIAIASGDEWTGRAEAPDGHPSTNHAKGAATQRAVERNMMLPFYDQLPPQADDVDGRPSTWVLLHHREGNMIRCELSRPTAINTSGYVETWSERIVLPTIELEPRPSVGVGDEPVQPDFAVRRRG
jgi:hypothetical protein